MLKRITLAALVAALAVPAIAADLPSVITKGPRFLATYRGCGTVIGVGLSGDVDKASVVGNAGAALKAYEVGGALTGSLEYLCGDGTSWKGIGVMAHYRSQDASVTNTTGVPGAISSDVGFTARAMLGGPISNITQFLPNLSTIFPALPVVQPGATTSHPYLFGSVHFDQVGAEYMTAAAKVWRVRPGFGTGVKMQMGPAGNAAGGTQYTLDLAVEYLLPNKGFDLGAPGNVTGAANQGAGAKVYAIVNF